MYYIGIDLGGTNIKGALVSETGEIAREVSRPTRVELGAEAVCDGIAAVITELSSGVDRTSLGGVGLGCPGTVDDETGCVLYANNLGWKNFDLRAAVKSRTDFDLRIGNDANVAALAEALVGCAKGAQSAVIVTLGTGVGGGVVLDGKMLTGYTGAASELGHMVIRAGGEECTCGRRGCFEAYASATALIRETKRAMAAHPESRMHAAAEENGAVDGRTAFIAAQRGDAAGGGPLSGRPRLRRCQHRQHLFPGGHRALRRRGQSGRRAACPAAGAGAGAELWLTLCRASHAHRALHARLPRGRHRRGAAGEAELKGRTEQWQGGQPLRRLPSLLHQMMRFIPRPLPRRARRAHSSGPARAGGGWGGR